MPTAKSRPTDLAKAPVDLSLGQPEASSPFPPDAMQHWQELVDLVAKLLRVPTGIITQAKPPFVEILKVNQNPETPYKAGMVVELAGHYCEEVLRTKKTLIIEDARLNDRWCNAPEIKAGMVSYLGLPLMWPDGSVFGTICVLDNKGNEYGQTFVGLMEKFKLLVESQLLLVQQNKMLQSRLNEIQTLRGIIPICAYCKQVRNDEGYWEQVEAYISRRSQVDFSHGLCPACEARLATDEGA